jgi:hypothetical protein
MSQESVSLIIVLGYFFAFVLFAYLGQRRTREKRRIFYKTLVEGLRNNSLTVLDDIINIYKGITDRSSQDLSYKVPLCKRLREFLVELVSKKLDSTIKDEQIASWKQKISGFIKEIEQGAPYDDLPIIEKNILDDMAMFIENNNKESIKNKLIELSGTIRARNDEFIKAQRINRWSLPLAIIGLILTIIFGFMSIRN